MATSVSLKDDPKRAQSQPPIHFKQAFTDSVATVEFGTTANWGDFLPGSLCTFETDQDCYLSFDGADPAADHGIKLTSAMGPTTFPYALAGFRVVRVSVNGTLKVTGNQMTAEVDTP